MSTSLASGNSFKLDIICSSAQELQQERNCLEKKLNDLRQKRHGLETTANTISGKLNQASDTNNKMLETLKVARHKADQAQEQSNSLEIIVENRRKKIDNLNEKVKQSKSEQAQEMALFEDKLTELATKLMEAKDFYADERLKAKIKEVKTQKDALETEAKETEKDITDVAENIKELSLKPAYDEVSVYVQDQIRTALLQEQARLHQVKEQMSAQVANLQQQLAGS